LKVVSFFRLRINSIFKATISGYRMKRAIGLIAFIILSGYTQAQTNVATDKLLGILQAKSVRVGQGLQSSYYLVELERNTRLGDLSRDSVHVIRRISTTHAIVRMPAKLPVPILSEILKVWQVNNEWKLSGDLVGKKSDRPESFNIQCQDPSGLIEFLKSKDLQFIHSRDVIVVHSSLNHVRSEILGRDDVLYVGRESNTPVDESRILELYLAPNRINQIHDEFPSLAGENLSLSIKEGPFDVGDIDLKSRGESVIVPEDPFSDHATDMATIAAGAGNSFITGKGPAWKARIVSSSYTGLAADANNSFTSNDTWIQNHSYGTTIENFYGTFARTYDLSANDLPELLHIFSSGNEGPATPSQGNYQGLAGVANLTGNFKMSKNSLSVGAVDTVGRALPFSSRGPAYDGRLKPELVAFSVQGTSNTAALVSGSAILLQEAYKNKFGVLPASALVKALLINSAEDAGPTGIDFLTGFGNVNAHKAIKTLLAENFISGTVSHNEIKSYDLSIPAGATWLKISIVWNDPAANANSAKALINDIDISLTTSTGEVILPWILNPTSAPTLLSQQATHGKDNLNNVEQITVKDLSAGTYTIQVKGFDIPQGPQTFYIAYQWEQDQSFEWKFPTGSDNFPYNGETGTYFYWSSTLDVPNGSLDYSIDDGATWMPIANNIDVTKGYYRWKNPPPINSSAKARMTIENQSFETEKFVISYPTQLSVGFNCTDSVMYRWEPVDGAASYQVYGLGEKFMEPLVATSDTFLVLKKDASLKTHYSVEPVLPDGSRGLRSPAVTYSSFGVGCYLISFYAELVAGEGLYLNTILGTTYGVSTVSFEREEDKVFHVIGQHEAGQEHLRFLDDEPHQGLNRYRARIEFENGQEIISEVIEEFYLSTIPFAVFPNPVSSGQELRIFSKIFTDQRYTFRLFRPDGTLVALTEISSDREFIPLDATPPGIYVFHLTSEEGKFIGKLIVR
jgi:hypothetical protein